MALEVEIDRDVCMGSGNCVYEAAGVFDLDDDGISTSSTPPPHPRSRSCRGTQVPDQAISVRRDAWRR